MSSENNHHVARKRFALLGANNEAELYATLKQSNAGDNFYGNNNAILTNFCLDTKLGEQDFLTAFTKWTKAQTKKSFKERLKIAGVTSCASVGAIGLNFIPGVGVLTISGAVAAATVATIVYEGPYKRNITGLGHHEEHHAQRILRLTQTMVGRILSSQGHNLTQHAVLSLKKSCKLSTMSRLVNKIKIPGALRVLSTTSSGAIVGNIFRGIMQWGSVAARAVLSGMQYLIPGLSLITLGFSYCADRLRHNTAAQSTDIYTKVVDVLCNPKSYTDGNIGVDLPKEAKIFNENLRACDLHGRMPWQAGFEVRGDTIARDSISNPRKVSAFPSWISAKVRQTTKAVGWNPPRDLCALPKSDNGMELSIEQIIKTREAYSPVLSPKVAEVTAARSMAKLQTIEPQHNYWRNRTSKEDAGFGHSLINAVA